MLSIILYGRNDDHGYNYHKRLAISLNCIAATLSDPDDEILFVDYNTPDSLPTIIEAIQDTLTPKTKSLLRVLRVRPSQHARFAKKSSLPLLEPIARNIALRRSNPKNKWILSTNIDMIFVPENKEDSLTRIVSGLEDGFYCLPRLEIPETLWELSLERSLPEKNIDFLRENSRKLHLHTIIQKDGFLQYDNPGDFQLFLRKDVFSIEGFDERMLKGWHVDANLCKRLSMVQKTPPFPKNKLLCFHCNHTQKETFLHGKKSTKNSWVEFVENPLISPILTQENWGLASDCIEEISLDSSRLKTHLNSSLLALKEEQSKDCKITINLNSYNQIKYSPFRVFIYLVDHLCNLPAETSIVYFGYNARLLHLIDDYLKGSLKKLFCIKDYFEGKTQISESVRCLDVKDAIPIGAVFIFDFGLDENTVLIYEKSRRKIKKVMLDFFQVIRQKKQIKKSAKFIGISLKNSDFNLIFSKHLSIHLNSHTTGISYGYLPSRKKIPSFSLPSREQVLKLGGYFVARYLFKYSDKIRKWARLKQLK